MSEKHIVKNPSKFMFLLASIYCRYFNVFILSMVIIFGVRSWVLSVGLVAFAIAMDVYRQKTSPGLQCGIEALANFHQYASENEECLKVGLHRQRHILYAVGVLILTYIVVLSSLIEIYSAKQLAPYFETVSFVIETGKWFFPIVRDHMPELIESGYPHRALYVGHLYSLSGLALICLLIFASLRALTSETYSMKFSIERRIESIKLRNNKATLEFRNQDYNFGRGVRWSIIVICLTYSFTYYYNPITWGGNATVASNWNVATSNIPFFLQIAFSLLIIGAAIYCYAWSQFVRSDYARQLMPVINNS